jgi:LPS export ABC transporter protein LptC
MSARNVITYVVLTLAAAGSWYLASTLESTESSPSVAKAGGDAFYIRSARILGTDDQGQLLYEIEAEYAEQQPGGDVDLRNVKISYTPSAEVPWTIRADNATISGTDRDQTLLQLSGHVVAVSNEGFAGRATELRSPTLEIDPKKYIAKTDSRVQIRIGPRSLTAVGMLALLQDNRLQLQSSVSGKFVP